MGLFLSKIQEKKITVGVVGLGYVGYPLALVFVEAGVHVIGFDIDPEKIKAIQEGKSYIKHINHGRLQRAVESKRLFSTDDFHKISECNAVILCVPTPLDSHLEPDLRYIRDTCETIAPFLQPHTIVSLESTTWPGTTKEVVQPILEGLGKVKVGKDLYLCYSPEREDPGNKEYCTRSIPKLLGGIDEKSLEFGIALYSLAVDKIVSTSSCEVAESAKLFENIFRSVNIALVNELKVIFDRMGIDVWEVIQASGTKPFGFMSFFPGPGLGGHCIPIDPYYLSWKAKEFGINTKFIELAGEINRSMPRYVVEKVQDCLNHYSKSIRGSKILILGLAYKSDVDDMRESPSLELMDLLESKGAKVDYHDPHISKIGKTREYCHLQGRTTAPLSKNYDCFLLSTSHSSFSSDEILSFGVPIVDTRNFFPKGEHVFTA